MRELNEHIFSFVNLTFNRTQDLNRQPDLYKKYKINLIFLKETECSIGKIFISYSFLIQTLKMG